MQCFCKQFSLQKQNKTETNQALTNLQKIIQTVENSIEGKKKKDPILLKKEK